MIPFSCEARNKPKRLGHFFEGSSNSSNAFLLRIVMSSIQHVSNVCTYTVLDVTNDGRRKSHCLATGTREVIIHCV